MRLLLDTNVFLWCFVETRRLGASRELIEAPENDVLVSAVCAWEIAIKHARDRLPLPSPIESFVPDAVRHLGAESVAVTQAHAFGVADLPPLHRDPFDRLLVAQALALDATLVTGDAVLAGYPAEILLV